MKTEKPMLFSGPLVRAILDGRKTETRRPVKPQPRMLSDFTERGPAWDCSSARAFIYPEHEPEIMAACCPLATRNETIWVRETFANIWSDVDHCDCPTPDTGDHCPEHDKLEYRADSGAVAPGGWEDFPPAERLVRWTPSIHMPRWASRISLLVTEVVAERVQDITATGVRAEGIDVPDTIDRACFRGSLRDIEQTRGVFAKLWDDIYCTKRGFAWAENPWVWVIKFAMISHDALDAYNHLLGMCLKAGHIPSSIQPTANDGVAFYFYPYKGKQEIYACLEIYEDGDVVAAWSNGVADDAWDIGDKPDARAVAQALADALAKVKS